MKLCFTHTIPTSLYILNVFHSCIRINTTINWNIYYISIVRLLLEIALDPHTRGFRQLSDNLQGNIEVNSRSILHTVHTLYMYFEQYSMLPV